MHMLDRRGALVSLTSLLAGCTYYECRDKLKEDYLPQAEQAHWVDPLTLEIDLGEALSDPAAVDPRRFALLRDQVDVVATYYCEVEICYREVDAVSGIPESLSWDPESPSRLRLHFADPIPGSACEPWPGQWADTQALALVYLYEYDPYTDTPDPDALEYADGRPISNFGPREALSWRDRCITTGTCELEGFCESRAHYDHEFENELWVACL